MINYKGYGIYKENLSENDMKKINEELIVKPVTIPDYTNDNILSFPVYRINLTKVYLPKFYGIEHFGSAQSSEREGLTISLKFNGQLKNDQVAYVNKLLIHINKHDACIGCSSTGSGKTVMALNILSRISKKTLIIVHKEFLMEQWISRINQFFKNARIGIIKQNIIDYENKDIVIGMLQSISKKKYDKKIFDEFGFTIIDECHHICSNHFSKALFQIGTKKMLGLSATPTRKDGLTKVLNWFLGPIITKENIDNDIETPVVQIIKANYENDIQLKYNFRNKVILPDLINKITFDNIRNNQIVEQVIKYTLDREILILTDRRQHCVVLKNLIEEELNKHNIKSTVGLYLGAMKNEDLNKSNECNIIIGTYQIASEGYDNSKLDTLIMATSKSDIIQIVGRILRKKNKNFPLIIDIADNKYLPYQCKKRKQYYKKNNMKILYEDEERYEEDNTYKYEINVEFRD